MIILPCPRRPDLDCIAGAYAYAEYLTQFKQQPALAWIAGEPDGEAEFYLQKYTHLKFANANDVANATGFVLVDFSVKDILPAPVTPDKVIQVIDHRLFTQPQIDFPNAEVQIDQVGAAATQIAEYFMDDNITPSREAAAMLYGAIYTHTLCLQSETTTKRDLKAAAWLKEFVPDAYNLVQQQLQARAHEITSQMPEILKIEMKTETSKFGTYGFTILELVDSQSFWQEHQDTIIAWAKTQTMPILVDVLDPANNTTILYSSDAAYTNALTEILKAEATEGIFNLHPAWFRKQIIPLLK